jgi:4-amino-4-deoxy-L-arabinose transferase-like glycosyltransferase
MVALLALSLRVYNLQSNPPELFEDELSGIVGAWQIVTTGHDIEKTWLPFIVTRLEFKQPVYFFATVIPHALFGPQVWAMRLPAALFGVSSAVLLIWLVRRVFARSRIEAVSAGALFAIVPWAVHYGRIAWEPGAFLPFAIAGIGLLWSGLEGHDRRRTLAAGIVLAIGAYTYHPALIVNLLMATAVLGLHARRLRAADWVSLAIAGAIGAILLLPYARAFLTESLFTSRLRLVNVFRDGITADTIGLAWRNYAEQWNPQWLFLEGQPNLRNHPGVALTFVWLVPFIGLGLVRALRRQTRVDLLVLAWLLVGALPAGLTNDGVPHFARGIFAMPALLLLAAGGLHWCHEWFGREQRWSAVGIAAMVATVAITQALPSYDYYFNKYPVESAPFWYYGASDSMAMVRANVPPGGAVCIEEPLPIPYLTFAHYVAYYLPSSDFRVIEGLDHPECSRASTYILHRVQTQLPQPRREVGLVRDLRGAPLYELSVVVR